MLAQKKLKPGQPGTKKLLTGYGARQQSLATASRWQKRGAVEFDAAARELSSASPSTRLVSC